MLDDVRSQLQGAWFWFDPQWEKVSDTLDIFDIEPPFTEAVRELYFADDQTGRAAGLPEWIYRLGWPRETRSTFQSS